MSRIGIKPVNIPANVEVNIDNKNYAVVKGPKGQLEQQLPKSMDIKVEGTEINVSRANDQKEQRSFHGLTRTLINNMVLGVTEGYQKTLEIVGVGYRAQKQGNKLVMNLGYSHPVEMVEPEGITFELPNTNTIIVRGIDKEEVGQTAAVIRTKRPPEVYHGKGIKYAEEHIRRKEGKAGKK